MAVEGVGKCLKILLFVFNFIFWVAGCAILGVGAYIRVKKDEYIQISTVHDFATGANLCIAAGAIVMVVAFFGCCGAWKESKCMLGVFFVFLLLIFCLEVTAGVLGYTNKEKVKDQVKKDLKNALDNYGKEDGGKKAIDAIQDKEKCCGITNYTDWFSTPFSQNGTRVPDSCCKEPAKDCAKSFDVTKINTKGCQSAVEDQLQNNLLLIGGVGVGICIIQLLGMIFSMCLICKIRSNEQYA